MIAHPRRQKRSALAGSMLAGLILFALPIPSLARPSLPTGERPRLERTPQGVVLSSEGKVTRAEVWKDGVIRILHQPAGRITQKLGLTVVAHPEQTPWKLEETEAYVVLSTSRMKVRIEKASGAVSLLDQQAHPLLEETAGGTAFTEGTTGSAKNTLLSKQSFKLQKDEGIYGLGQHPNGPSIDYRGSSVELLQSNGKVAVPVLLSSLGYALFWNNPAVTQVDVGKSNADTIQWSSEAGDGVDYFFFEGPQPDKAIGEYRWLTGSAPMFPRWSWGFWQSRERYQTQKELLDIVAQYRQRHLPLDGIIQDWQYWAPLNQETAENGWGSHKFDPARYPDPAEMVKAIHDQHAHLMLVSWPKFDVTENNVSIPNLKELEAVHGAYEMVVPNVFPPGKAKWYDPFGDKAREVYWKQLKEKLFPYGVDAWWLDASEAELSGKWGEFRNFQTALGSGALFFNAYPLEHTRTLYEGQRATTSDKRVFLLTRSAFAGQQRNAAVTWSGDITGNWKVFEEQIPAGLNFVASGIPYWNTDIGGFFGSNPDDPKYTELFTRWFQYGAFTPMFRVHGTNKPKEIWRFDAATQKTLSDSLELRYHLLPYIYSVSWMVTNSGYTMMRPLVMDFREDLVTRNIGNQFLFGPSLLVNPVTQPGASSRTVYLPKGTPWFDFWTGQTISGGTTLEASAPIQRLPLYVRAGSILPYGPKIEWSDQKLAEPLELRIYPGADGSFALYEDEGDNYNYEKGQQATIPLHWNDKTHTLTIGARKGSYPSMSQSRVFHIVCVSAGHGAGISSTETFDRSVTYQGVELRIKIDKKQL